MGKIGKTIGRSFFSNCWITILILLIQGRLDGVAFYLDRRGLHLMGLRNNAIVHLRNDKKNEKWYPLWFTGQIHVFPRRFLKKKAFILKWTRKKLA